MFRSHKPDPYCAFKNDVERRKALIARDVRFVLIAGIGTVVVGTSTPWKEVFGWFKIFMS